MSGFFRSVRATTAAIALLTALGGPALAQQATTDEIVVTGVRTQPRTTLDTPVPVDVFNADDLRATGAVGNELGAALVTLAPSFNFPRQSNSGSSDHVRSGQLRGLSPDQTLVLVNGKRRHTSAIVNSETKIGRGTAATDFNTIPLAAVSRVEVLRDGAGAQYGSDAIAGVVNVILDTAPEGSRLNVTYGAHKTHLDPVNKDITDGETVTVDGSTGYRLGADGFLRVGAEYINRNATNRAGFDQVPFFVDQTPANLAAAGKRNYTEGDPDTEAFNLFYNAETALGAATFYSFATYGERETRNGATFFRYPDGVDNVRAIYPNGFRPASKGDSKDVSVVAGLKGAFAGWDWDGSVAYGRNTFEYGVDRSLNASLGAASPTSFKSGRYEFDQTTVNLGAQRDFNVGGFASPVTLAAGVEYRRETYQTEAGDPASYAAGPFDATIGAQGAPGLTPADVVDIDRDVWSVYLDASADVTDRLFVNAAARYEDYSDFDAKATGKLSAIYKITDAFALRGAVSNSIRAPGLAQVGFSDTTLSFGDARALIRTRTLRVDDSIARALGAKSLKPETSQNFSVGFTAQATPSITLTVDAFQVNVSDRVTLSDRLFGTALANFVQAQPGGAGVQSVRFFTNAIDTETKGVDVVAAWKGEALKGDVGVTVAYSYAQTDIDSFAPTPAALLALDPTFRLIGVEEINTIEEAAPRDKLVVTADWQGARFGALARVSHYGSAVRVFNFGGGFEPRQRYGAETQLDLEGTFAFNEHVKAAIGANNILDEYPDLSSADINFFGNLPYDILSPIGVNGRFVYARVSASF